MFVSGLVLERAISQAHRANRDLQRQWDQTFLLLMVRMRQAFPSRFFIFRPMLQIETKPLADSRGNSMTNTTD